MVDTMLEVLAVRYEGEPASTRIKGKGKEKEKEKRSALRVRGL